MAAPGDWSAGNQNQFILENVIGSLEFVIAFRKNYPPDFETCPGPRSDNFQGSIKSGGGLIKLICKR